MAGAVYHLLDRGDRREPIFRDDRDREAFLTTLGEASPRTGWLRRLTPLRKRRGWSQHLERFVKVYFADEPDIPFPEKKTLKGFSAVTA